MTTQFLNVEGVKATKEEAEEMVRLYDLHPEPFSYNGIRLAFLMFVAKERWAEANRHKLRLV